MIYFIKLNNCYYILILIKNIIYVHLLLEQCYEINFKGNDYSIFHSNKFYIIGKIINGLVVLEVNDVYFILSKLRERKRDDLNFTYL